MNNKKLTKDELKNLVSKVLQIVAEMNDRASLLLGEGKIDFGQRTSIFNKGTDLIREANKAANLLLNQIITDANQPKQTIENALQKVQEAIGRLQEFQQVIDVLTKILTIFTVITMAINSGATVPVIITTAVSELQQLIEGIQKKPQPPQPT